MRIVGRTIVKGLLAASALGLVASAAGAQTASAPVQAYAGGVSPYYGNINPFYGNINAFYGNINAFYGNINAFYGNINPFYGNINAFWGNINPFYGNINAFWGNINPFYGNINAFAESTQTADGYIKPTWGNIGGFWQQVGPMWNGISANWGAIDPNAANAAAQYAGVASQLNGLVDTSRAFWENAVQSRTGKSFDEAFAQPMLAKWGVDLNDPANLAKLTLAGRERFMLDWYDQLMTFSGADHVDWWMRAINWSPALTTTLGSGVRTQIGILDFSIVGDQLNDSVKKYDGISTFSNGHGTAVASLIVSPQDGKGVMGIAPMAQVIAYNPFDASGTANWADVTKGVSMLLKNGASVINMSLGVPGWTMNSGWNDVFSNDAVKKASKNTVFVIAAGNDGIAQTQNTVIELPSLPAFVLVGSVDPTGQISSFSNQPGNACIVSKAGDKCKAENQLMNRFLVAPGEAILVADDQGGVTRMSGTSFAAPLVSGAVALIQNRWPWLSKDSDSIVKILLATAKDLGAPGVDPVYGAGQLDVARAVQPIDGAKLQWYQAGLLGKILPVDSRTITQASAATKAKWEANGVYYYLYENLDGVTLAGLSTSKQFRDFAVPLSTKLFGQSVSSADGTQQMLQDYLYKIYVNPTSSTSGFSGLRGFTSFAERGGTIGHEGGYTLTMSMAPKTRTFGYVQSNMPYQTAVRFGTPDGKAGVRMGWGDGAVQLGARGMFGMTSDYDVNAGGANPLLGMASGGAYGSMDVAVARGLTVTAGYTERRMRRDARFLARADVAVLGGLQDRSAAQHVGIAYAATRGLTINASMTRLQEDQAVLGVRSVDPNDLAKGSATSGVTLGADLQLPAGFGLAVTGTRGNTRDRGAAYRNLTIANGGLVTTSYAVAFSKEHLIDGRDRARLTFSQPMHVERGQMTYSGVEVIDRAEGTLGVVSRTFDLPTPARQYVGEFLYGRVLGSTSEISLFGRAQLNRAATPNGTPTLMAGTRLTVGF